VATTVALDAGSETLDDLLALLPARRRVLSWVRHGEGLVGWGTAAEIRTSGPERFAHAAKWFEELAAVSAVSDPVGEPGTGLVGFGSFAFADLPGFSVLKVPAVVVGKRGDTAWVTTVGPAAASPPPLAPTPDPEAPRDVVFADAYVDGEHWMRIVADAVGRLQHGDLDKVVLARARLAAAAAPNANRAVLRRRGGDLPLGEERGAFRHPLGDAGFDPVHLRPSRENGGWGLWMLDRLATRWGVERNHVTKVWFELGSAVSGARAPGT
jgi:menaquinone-specific isochorismate synthase